MAITNSSLASGTNNLLTVPAGKKYAITTILVCNTYTPDPVDPNLGEAEFDLHLITSADVIASGIYEFAIDDVNRVINGLNLKAGETHSFDSEKLILEAGDVIAIVASAINLSATVSYLEI